MADHDDWTAHDDDQLRGALATLQRDVDALPLPDVRFVKARGVRRRRQRALALTAAAAAAAVVVGTVGFSQLGRDATLPVTPATQTPAPVPTALPTASATTGSLDEPGALPLLQEWTRTLDLQGAARMTTQDPKSSDWSSFECLTSVPNGQAQRQEVTLDAGGFQGGQTRFKVSSGLDPATVAGSMANDISGCQQGPDFTVGALTETDAGSLFSYTAGDAGSGWFAVVQGEADVTLIQVVDPTHATSTYTKAQVRALAEVAKERLARYGTGATSSGGATGTTTPPNVGPTGSTRALSQDMPVSGQQPVPASPLFVAASQWRSQALSGGVATSAGPGALEGSTAIASCETDAQQSGIGGRVGVVSVMAGTGTSSYVGRQRVQLDESSGPDVQQAYVEARQTEANALYAKGCRFGNGTVRSTAGPSKGTYRLDTVFSDGSPTLSEWVGVTAQKTRGAVSTVVITRMSDPRQGFAELDRLLMLARQK